jgi:hypothetical protein
LKSGFRLGLFWCLIVCKAGLSITAASTNPSATDDFHSFGYPGHHPKILVQSPNAIGEKLDASPDYIFN